MAIPEQDKRSALEHFEAIRRSDRHRRKGSPLIETNRVVENTLPSVCGDPLSSPGVVP